MIVDVRLEVTDEQRNATAVLSNSKAVKRLAGRVEVTDIVRMFFTACACGDTSGLARPMSGASESIELAGLEAVPT